MKFQSSKELLEQAIDLLKRIQANENVIFSPSCRHSFRGWYKSRRIPNLWTRRCYKCRYKELSYKEH